MKISKVIKPGQPGTKKLVRQYGDNLICVRYRYDDEQKRMLKTAEIVIEHMPWQPRPGKIPSNKIVNLRVALDDIETRNRVKSVGGKWNPRDKVWRLAYKDVLKLELADRVVD